MIERIPAVEYSADIAKSIVDFRGQISCCRGAWVVGATADTLKPVDIDLWKQIPGRSLCRQHDIAVIVRVGQMHTSRTYIAHQQGQVPRQFSLHSQVPLHVVAAMPRLVRETRQAGLRSQERSRSRIKCTRQNGRVLQESRLAEGEPRHWGIIDVDQRQHVKNSKPAPHRGLAISKWVPGKSHTRVEIAKRGIWNRQRRAELRARIRYVDQRSDLAVDFTRQCCHLPTQAQVQREIGAGAPIILHIKTQQTLANSCFRIARDSCRESAGLIEKKISNRRKSKRAAGFAELVYVELHPLDGGPEFQRMGSVSPKSIVVYLKRVPVKLAGPIGLHASGELSQPGNHHLRGKRPGYRGGRGVIR